MNSARRFNLQLRLGHALGLRLSPQCGHRTWDYPARRACECLTAFLIEELNDGGHVLSMGAREIHRRLFNVELIGNVRLKHFQPYSPPPNVIPQRLRLRGNPDYRSVSLDCGRSSGIRWSGWLGAGVLRSDLSRSARRGTPSNWG